MRVAIGKTTWIMVQITVGITVVMMRITMKRTERIKTLSTITAHFMRAAQCSSLLGLQRTSTKNVRWKTSKRKPVKVWTTELK